MHPPRASPQLPTSNMSQSKHSIAFAVFAVAASSLAGAQTLEITAQPATATILLLKPQDQSLVPIWTGTAKLTLEKESPNMVVVRLEGYCDATRSFPKNVDYKDKRVTIALKRRFVQLAAEPYDTTLFVNGERRGQRALEVDVDEEQATTVELK